MPCDAGRLWTLCDAVARLRGKEREANGKRQKKTEIACYSRADHCRPCEARSPLHYTECDCMYTESLLLLFASC